MKKPETCKWCKTKFNKKNSWHIYCHPNCRKYHWRSKPENQERVKRWAKEWLYKKRLEDFTNNLQDFISTSKDYIELEKTFNSNQE